MTSSCPYARRWCHGSTLRRQPWHRPPGGAQPRRWLVYDLAAQWDGLGLDRQRALVELCIESVTIASAKGRGRAGRFDASRVQAPVWRA